MLITKWLDIINLYHYHETNMPFEQPLLFWHPIPLYITLYILHLSFCAEIQLDMSQKAQ